MVKSAPVSVSTCTSECCHFQFYLFRHNEFGFISQQAIRDVKIEAEIRAALFGIETVKSIFKGSLGKGF